MRKRSLITLILVLTLVLPVYGSIDVGAIDEKGTISNYQDEELKSIEETITILSSDEFKGRLTGTEGNKKAIEFIVNKFKEIGLETFENNSYFHEYTQKVYNPDESEHSLLVEFEDGTKKEYIYGRDYIDRLRNQNLEITAPITFDVKDKDISNKIVVIDENTDKGDLWDRAKGMLVKTDTFFGSTRVWEKEMLMLQIKENLYNDLKNNDVKQITSKTKYIQRDIKAKNVIGKIKGKDSSKAVVISAHFDHVGWDGETIFNGAVDNGSGTTVMLNVAKRLKEYSKSEGFNMDILLCGFNGEEWGLYGSKAFAEYIIDKYDNIYNINIDCVGKKDNKETVFGGNNGFNGELVEALEKVANEHGVEIADKNYGSSDHQSFNSLNISGISIGQPNLLSRDSKYRIHTPKDTVESVDIKKLKKISDIVYDFIIKNNGKTFKINDNYGPYGGPGDKTWNKVHKKTRDINLKFDEELVIEIDEVLFKMTGGSFSGSIEEVNEYYPDINIPKTMGEYELDNITLGGSYSISTVNKNEEYPKEKIGKIQKRDLSLDNLDTIALKYSNGDESVYLEVEKNYTRSMDAEYMLENYNIEEISLNGLEYKLLYSKEHGTITQAYTVVDNNSNRYGVTLMRVGKEKLESIMTDEIRIVPKNTKEEMKKTINKFDLKEMISNMSI
ncbi:M28 family metallopeptidase [Dethiothermospora halolimnae]|uniref:M28 family metallopeptidase n=1 Tax=Dethiothermospora halolimnae TaxID=3114390 RepID=UPI003CCBB1A5